MKQWNISNLLEIEVLRATIAVHFIMFLRKEPMAADCSTARWQRKHQSWSYHIVPHLSSVQQIEPCVSMVNKSQATSYRPHKITQTQLTMLYIVHATNIQEMGRSLVITTSYKPLDINKKNITIIENSF